MKRKWNVVSASRRYSIGFYVLSIIMFLRFFLTIVIYTYFAHVLLVGGMGNDLAKMHERMVMKNQEWGKGASEIEGSEKIQWRRNRLLSFGRSLICSCSHVNILEFHVWHLTDSSLNLDTTYWCYILYTVYTVIQPTTAFDDFLMAVQYTRLQSIMPTWLSFPMFDYWWNTSKIELEPFRRHRIHTNGICVCIVFGNHASIQYSSRRVSHLISILNKRFIAMRLQSINGSSSNSFSNSTLPVKTNSPKTQEKNLIRLNFFWNHSEQKLWWNEPNTTEWHFDIIFFTVVNTAIAVTDSQQCVSFGIDIANRINLIWQIACCFKRNPFVEVASLRLGKPSEHTPQNGHETQSAKFLRRRIRSENRSLPHRHAGQIRCDTYGDTFHYIIEILWILGIRIKIVFFSKLNS